MTFNGQIKNGVVVLEGNPPLPEGTQVRVELVEQPAEAAHGQPLSLGQRLMRFSGRAKGLPRDASRNHDHYLYGTPKR